MSSENRPELLAALGELERAALAAAVAQDWSVSVEVAGELVPLVHRRPDRHLVLTLAAEPRAKVSVGRPRGRRNAQGQGAAPSPQNRAQGRRSPRNASGACDQWSQGATRWQGEE